MSSRVHGIFSCLHDVLLDNYATVCIGVDTYVMRNSSVTSQSFVHLKKLLSVSI